MEAPDYLFKEVIDWASHAKALNYNFCPTHSTCASVINDLKIHFNMDNLKPIISEVKLEAVIDRVSVVSFDFLEQLTALLTDTSLMHPDNLVLNPAITKDDGSVDYSPWFLSYECPEKVLDEVLSGRWFRDTVALLAKNPNDFICPLILYIDKTFIDPMRSHFNLEPVNFTLAIFKRNCRTKFSFWRTLGYIPNLPSSDVNNPRSGYKARNDHLVLESVLSSLIAVQCDPTILDNFHLRIGNVVKKVNLHVPIVFIISDTQGADKLCGHYVSYREMSHVYIERHCISPPH